MRICIEKNVNGKGEVKKFYYFSILFLRKNCGCRGDFDILEVKRRKVLLI